MIVRIRGHLQLLIWEFCQFILFYSFLDELTATKVLVIILFMWMLTWWVVLYTHHG